MSTNVEREKPACAVWRRQQVRLGLLPIVCRCSVFKSCSDATLTTGPGGSSFRYERSRSTSQWMDAVASALRSCVHAPPNNIIVFAHEITISIRYYSNADLNLSSWDKPTESAATYLPHAALSLPPGWIEQFDRQSGRYFYVNTVTNASAWDLPDGIAINGKLFDFETCDQIEVSFSTVSSPA